MPTAISSLFRHLAGLGEDVWEGVDQWASGLLLVLLGWPFILLMVALQRDLVDPGNTVAMLSLLPILPAITLLLISPSVTIGSFATPATKKLAEALVTILAIELLIGWLLVVVPVQNDPSLMWQYFLGMAILILLAGSQFRKVMRIAWKVIGVVTIAWTITLFMGGRDDAMNTIRSMRPGSGSAPAVSALAARRDAIVNRVLDAEEARVDREIARSANAIYTTSQCETMSRYMDKIPASMAVVDSLITITAGQSYRLVWSGAEPYPLRDNMGSGWPNTGRVRVQITPIDGNQRFGIGRWWDASTGRYPSVAVGDQSNGPYCNGAELFEYSLPFGLLHESWPLATALVPDMANTDSQVFEFDGSGRLTIEVDARQGNPTLVFVENNPGGPRMESAVFIVDIQQIVP